jgi:hypothetical protein
MPEEPWEWVRITTGKGTEATYYNVASIKAVRIRRAGPNPELVIEWKIAAKDSESILKGDAANQFMQYLDARRLYVAGDPTN